MGRTLAIAVATDSIGRYACKQTALHLLMEYWLLYDGDCGFCQRWIEWARRRGAEQVVHFEPCASATELRNQSGITDDDCANAAFLVEVRDGRVVNTRRAAAAINALLRRLPGRRNAVYRILGGVYLVPGIRHLEELGYRVVARHRYRLGSGSCKVR